MLLSLKGHTYAPILKLANTKPEVKLVLKNQQYILQFLYLSMLIFKQSQKTLEQGSVVLNVVADC